jgi:hypothetical protein
MARNEQHFDPLAILAALERNYVSYVLIGGLAQVLRGVDLVTSGVDVCPSFAKHNLDRLNLAIIELDATRNDRRVALDEETLTREPAVEEVTGAGRVRVIGSPAGVPNGFVDLRRAASQEDLGRGLRPLVASTGDLAAMAAALHRDTDVQRLPALRRIVELEADRGQALQRPPPPAKAIRTRVASPGRRINR